MSHFFAVIDPNLFGNKLAIQETLSRLLEEIRQLDSIGDESVRIPGDREEQEKEISLQEGIALEDKTIESLKRIAHQHYISFNID